MRTTIDMSAELHQQLKAIARDTSRSLSQVAEELMQRALTSRGNQDQTLQINPRTGFPQLELSRIVTSEDVRSLEDDE